MNSQSHLENEKKSNTAVMTAIVSLATMILIFMTAVFYSLPSNVLSVKDDSPPRVFFTRFLPEAWGFFTKPPDSSEFSAFVVHQDQVVSALKFPHSKAENWFGLLREHRAQGPEIAELSAQIDGTKWVTCSQVQGDCVLRVSRDQLVEVENFSPVKTLCGQLVLVETKPVEWSYRASYIGWRQEIRAVHIDSRCE